MCSTLAGNYRCMHLSAFGMRLVLVAAGLGCRAQNAVLKTTEDGQAQDTFWITDLRGRKVSASSSCRHLKQSSSRGLNAA
jgi:UTP:GlnB (protein PII) uridylyltransferase